MNVWAALLLQDKESKLQRMMRGSDAVEIEVVHYTDKSKAAIIRRIKAKGRKGWYLVSEPQFNLIVEWKNGGSKVAGINTTVWFQRPKQTAKAGR